MAEAMPEQKTKISVASENPKRAGIQRTHQFPGVCAMRMMNIASPRKKSSRGSRTRAAAAGRRAGSAGAAKDPMSAPVVAIFYTPNTDLRGESPRNRAHTSLGWGDWQAFEGPFPGS